MYGDFIFNHKDFKIIIENSGTSAVEALISAFRDGTIPAFEYNLRSGDITLDSKKIASVSTKQTRSNGLYGLYFYRFRQNAERILKTL